MAQKYAVYQLTKVTGKKEYKVSSTEVCKSLKEAYRVLELWDEDLDGPVTVNNKTGKFVAYKLYDRALYVPNWKEGPNGMKLIGAYARFPIYFIDVYPNPYKHYVVRPERLWEGHYELAIKGME